MPRKRRTAKARREERLPAPSTVDVLLLGWGAPIRRDEDGDDVFEVFDLGEQGMVEVWRRHERYLLAEAARRGIAKPWAPNSLRGLADGNE